ncbi:hypothetical protein BDQ17DRAFT_1431064 [Cyathus striatus]|nr:hypothetical protein BDQ17DRAFT_1431064 [Cyathus striatus]
MKFTSVVSSILFLEVSLQVAIAAPVKFKHEPVTTIVLPKPIFPVPIAPVHGKVPLDPETPDVFRWGW